MKVDSYTLHFQNLTQIRELAKRDPQLALKKLCAEFESLLWYEILKGLDRGDIKSGFFPETLERRIFQDYLYQEIARRVSGREGGLGDYLRKNLEKSPYFKNKLFKAENR
ncbi:MAG: hypothetical protein N2327_03870 [Caldimicrobium sp.]|nr:hypothetical protein [Caldimicrobium sp.]MCX7873555.1 hypothetical protein [Caldimicrobium sp.]MDW8094060.1 hypothetical protein [Caldimicrobium sp.]